MEQQADHSQEPSYGLDQSQNKVAIPRIPRPEPLSKLPSTRNRVPRACHNCHRRKIKCSGRLPRCSYCDKFNKKCVYSTNRRDRLAEAIGHKESLLSFLRELSGRVDGNNRLLIENALQKSAAEDDALSPQDPQEESSKSLPSCFSDNEQSRAQSPQSPNLISDASESTAHAYGEASPFEPQRNRQGDNASPYAGRSNAIVAGNISMGFICETQWLQELKCGIKRNGCPGTSSPSSSSSSSSNLCGMNFYLDDQGVQLPNIGNPFHLPNESVARHLFHTYQTTVHFAYPLLPGKLEAQLHTYYFSIRNQQSILMPPRWFAMVNLVFAIGARCSSLMNPEWYQDPTQATFFVSRAYKLLGFNETSMILCEPDQSMVQATALLAFYYLCIGHANRAWLTLSDALRLALALGYHERQLPSNNPEEQQAKSQIWWALYNLECFLSSLIGKPCMLRKEDITAPLPSDMATPTKQGSIDDPAMPFLDAQVRIATHTQRVLSNLYTESRSLRPWPQIQSTITSLLSSLDTWRLEAMPQHLQSSDINSVLEHQQILLKKQYLRLVILITRPCLRRIELSISQPTVPSISPIDQNLAEMCIRAAQDVVAILPAEINTRALYGKGPWWSIVHNFLQSSAILLIALSLRAHFPVPLIATSTASFRKIIAWLLAMRSANDLARRAYFILRDVVKTGEAGLWPEILDMFPEE